MTITPDCCRRRMSTVIWITADLLIAASLVCKTAFQPTVFSALICAPNSSENIANHITRTEVELSPLCVWLLFHQRVSVVSNIKIEKPLCCLHAALTSISDEHIIGHWDTDTILLDGISYFCPDQRLMLHN